MPKYMYISLVETTKLCFSFKVTYLCVSLQISLVKNILNRSTGDMLSSLICCTFVSFQLLICPTSDDLLFILLFSKVTPHFVFTLYIFKFYLRFLFYIIFLSVMNCCKFQLCIVINSSFIN